MPATPAGATGGNMRLNFADDAQALAALKRLIAEARGLPHPARRKKAA